MAVIATHKGIEINCDETGRFSAIIDGQWQTERSVTKLKKRIEERSITVPLVELDTQGYDMRDFAVQEVFEVRDDPHYGFYGIPAKSTSRYGQRYRNLYVPSEEGLARVRTLNQLYTEKVREQKEWYDTQFKQITDAMEPITVERFEELKAAAVVERAAAQEG
jgi:hypothetical protein